MMSLRGGAELSISPTLFEPWGPTRPQETSQTPQRAPRGQDPKRAPRWPQVTSESLSQQHLNSPGDCFLMVGSLASRHGHTLGVSIPFRASLGRQLLGTRFIMPPHPSPHPPSPSPCLSYQPARSPTRARQDWASDLSRIHSSPPPSPKKGTKGRAEGSQPDRGASSVPKSCARRGRLSGQAAPQRRASCTGSR